MQLQNILEVALAENTEDSRKQALVELRNIAPSQDKNYVEVALKDSTTSLHNLDDIISGRHYEVWKHNNIKQESFEKAQLTANRNIVANTDKVFNEIESPNKISIDKYGDIDVNPEKVLEFGRNGEQFYGRIPDNISQDKIQKALEYFNTRLSLKDRKVMLENVIDSIDDIFNKEKKKISLKKYVKAINEQLNDEEKVRLLSLIVKSKAE